MGVDLKGKDLGPNLSQRKKYGKYRARLITASGKRVDRIFDNVKEAKQWLANAKYEDANSILILNNKTSVDCGINNGLDLKKTTRDLIQLEIIEIVMKLIFNQSLVE